MIKNHWHKRQSDHCCRAHKLCLKVSTSAIRGHDLVHKAGQRHLGAAFGSTEFRALKMGRISLVPQAPIRANADIYS